MRLLAGLGHTRRVILGDTLLNNFSPREIEVVLAHEIGHHVYHHMTKMILLGLVYTGVSFFVCDRVLVSWVTAQSRDRSSYADCPVHALALIMFVVTVFSLALSPLRNGLSRRFETACDRYALQVTGDAEAYRVGLHQSGPAQQDRPEPSAVGSLLVARSSARGRSPGSRQRTRGICRHAVGARRHCSIRACRHVRRHSRTTQLPPIRRMRWRISSTQMVARTRCTGSPVDLTS